LIAESVNRNGNDVKMRSVGVSVRVGNHQGLQAQVRITDLKAQQQNANKLAKAQLGGKRTRQDVISDFTSRGGRARVLPQNQNSLAMPPNPAIQQAFEQQLTGNTSIAEDNEIMREMFGAEQ
jgi:hypothetical protein